MKPLIAATLLALTASASAAFTVGPIFPVVTFPEAQTETAPIDGPSLSTQNTVAK